MISTSWFAILFFNIYVAGKHIPGRNGGGVGNSTIFPFRPYEDYQISDGIAGKCKEEADAVFVDPFKNTSPKDLTDADLNNLRNMSREAVINEKFYVEALKKVDPKSEIRSQLLSGMIANKCLKLIGAIQTINIETGMKLSVKDGPARLQELNEKLARNIATDKKSAGKKKISYLSLAKKPSPDDSKKKKNSGSKLNKRLKSNTE